MAKLWAKIVNKGKILRQSTVSCAFAEIPEALAEICREFDLPIPLWLGKQERELDQFRLTAFTQDNFIEQIPFQKLEIEYIEDENKKRKSQDPRNQF